MATNLIDNADILTANGVPRWTFVSAPLRDQFPFAPIVLIRVHPTGFAATPSGTGWLVRPDVVVTASHVVPRVLPNSSVMLADHQFEVIPGPDWRSQFVRRVTRHPSLDLALVHLPSALVSTRTASLFFQSDCLVLRPRSTSALVGGTVHLAGFALETGQGMISAQGRVDSLRSGALFYNLDTVDGVSGAPVMVIPANREPEVVALHVAGRDFSAAARAANRNVGLHLDAGAVAWINRNA